MEPLTPSIGARGCIVSIVSALLIFLHLGARHNEQGSITDEYWPHPNLSHYVSPDHSSLLGSLGSALCDGVTRGHNKMSSSQNKYFLLCPALMTPAGPGSRDQVASIVTLSQIGHHCITSTIQQMGESNANSHLFTVLPLSMSI